MVLVMMADVGEPIVDLEIALDEGHACRARERGEPVEEAVDAHERDETQPEPNEDEYLLVEQVDGQCALNGVAVVVLAERADDKVTHGDARKARRLPEVLALDEIAEHLEAVDVEVWSHECVEHKELTAHVGHIEQLGENVESADVIARAVVGQEAAADLAANDANERVVVVVAVVIDGAIDELDSVAHGLVARLAGRGVHGVDDLHDRLGVEAARLG